MDLNKLPMLTTQSDPFRYLFPVFILRKMAKAKSAYGAFLVNFPDSTQDFYAVYKKVEPLFMYATF